MNKNPEKPKRNLTPKQERAFKLISHEFGRLLSHKDAAALMSISVSQFNKLLAEVKKRRPELWKGCSLNEMKAYIYAVNLGMQNSEIAKEMDLASPNAAAKLIQSCKKKGLPFGYDLRKKGWNPTHDVTRDSGADAAAAAVKRLQRRERTQETSETTNARKLSPAEFKAERDRIAKERFWEQFGESVPEPREPYRLDEWTKLYEPDKPDKPDNS